MDRNLALEAVRVTEAAALNCARLTGRGDERAADQAAVDAMRKAFDALAIDGTVVIGEGERDEAPMLYIGEKVGSGGPKVDIALDPLEGTTICATGAPNALSVIAMADAGNLLHCPDTYMEKIATGPVGRGVVDLDKTPTENLRALAEAKRCRVEDLTVIILSRPRHEAIIKEVRQAGARIRLIGDGDVSAAIATTKPETGIDVLLGIGGAPEGVLAAAALRCAGGEFQGRLAPRNNEEIERAKKMGVTDIKKKFKIDELARGDVMFAATGVTDGDYLQGVHFFAGGATTQSVVMRSRSHTVRLIKPHTTSTTSRIIDVEVKLAGRVFPLSLTLSLREREG
ncbi:MAG: class II fructose-bisphosphatase [Deltaproteobacteria bacterium]|nr:class II fructose-bisphosphatase [Deltaproteobacteria bacterium]